MKSVVLLQNLYFLQFLTTDINFRYILYRAARDPGRRTGAIAPLLTIIHS